jgi:hypothetical protein
MLIEMLFFSLVVFFISYLAAKHPVTDQGKLPALIVLIAWGSLVFGIFIAK